MLVGVAALGGCAGAPDATWHVPPVYRGADAVDDAVPAVMPSSRQPAATPDLPPEAGTPTGPAATAGSGPAPAAYDHVGYAMWRGEGSTEQAIGAASHRTLPLGSFAEVTSLETGRTILVQISHRGPDRADREIVLSVGAAQALGFDARAIGGVRVRAITPSPVDAAALRQGRMAAPRLDTPEPVLRALRRQLPVVGAAIPARDAGSSPSGNTMRRTSVGKAAANPMPLTSASAAAPQREYTPSAPLRSERAPRVAPAPSTSVHTVPTQSGFLVQIAALSSEDRARDLARRVRGSVSGGNGVWRIRRGPFRDLHSAQAARDDAVRHGYGDAAILMAP